MWRLIVTFRRVVVAFVIMSAVSPIAAAEPRCPSSLQTSCLAALLKCFNPAGSCRYHSGASRTTVRWANGARRIMGGGYRIKLVAAGGKRCATGTEVFPQAGLGLLTKFDRHGKRWVISYLPVTTNGDVAVYCPDGSVETHSAPEFFAAPAGCTGLATRAAADCVS